MSRAADERSAEPAPVEGDKATAAVEVPVITFDQAVEAQAEAMLRAKIERFPWWPGVKPEIRAELLEADVQRYWILMWEEAAEKVRSERAQ